jgi:hypothetical protein
MRVVLLVAFIASLAACPNFDRSDRVQDMRVLAMKTEPAEILFSPLFLTPPSQRPPGLPLPSVDVNVEVFAFDPRGGHTTTSFQLCPDFATDSTCRLYDPTQDIAKAPADARPDIKQALTPQVFHDQISPTATPIGLVQPSTTKFEFNSHIIDFLLPKDSNGNPQASIFPILPRVVVQAQNDDAKSPAVIKERAFKRIPLSLDLTSPDLPPDVVQNLANGLGIKLCTAPIPDSIFEKQGRADCLEKRVPNNNPDLAGFLFEKDQNNLTHGTATVDVVTPTVVAGSVLSADPGDVIALTPVFVPHVVEKYQVVSFDVAASKIILLNRIEDIACNWFTTRGDVGNTLTAIQFGPSLGTTWTLPTDAKSGERDSLYLVVLDQRGGTSFGEITVEYR